MVAKVLRIIDVVLTLAGRCAAAQLGAQLRERRTRGEGLEVLR